MDGRIISVRRTIGKPATSAALLSSLMLGVSACADGEAGAEQRPSPTMSSSGSSTSSPSPGRPSASSIPSPPGRYVPASAAGPAQNVPLPVMPEEAKEFSKEGLEAFARHWYALANYGYETGDTEPLRAISGPNCLACNNWYPVVQNGFSGEDWIAGALIDVRSVVSEFRVTPEGKYQVLIQITQEPLEFYGPEGHQGTTGGGGPPAVMMIEGIYGPSGWTADDAVTIQK